LRSTLSVSRRAKPRPTRADLPSCPTIAVRSCSTSPHAANARQQRASVGVCRLGEAVTLLTECDTAEAAPPECRRVSTVSERPESAANVSAHRLIVPSPQPGTSRHRPIRPRCPNSSPRAGGRSQSASTKHIRGGADLLCRPQSWHRTSRCRCRTWEFRWSHR